MARYDKATGWGREVERAVEEKDWRSEEYGAAAVSGGAKNPIRIGLLGLARLVGGSARFAVLGSDLVSGGGAKEGARGKSRMMTGHAESPRVIAVFLELQEARSSKDELRSRSRLVLRTTVFAENWRGATRSMGGEAGRTVGEEGTMMNASARERS